MSSSSYRYYLCWGNKTWFHPDSQFHIGGYQSPPFRKDRSKYGGGKTVYVREGFIAKRLADLERSTSETICIEVMISKKKWCIIFVYRPPHSNNKKVFFSELTTSLNQATNKYDNIIVMGDLNIDTLKMELTPIITYLIYMILFP